MQNAIEIQVFVSCPKDVNAEKSIVESVCTTLNSTAISIGCEIRFQLRDWSEIVGQFGENPQRIINNTISGYDIYIGIWWMRFGTKTGNINKNTGKEYESGTFEEFSIAYENWKSFNLPKLFVFFKDPIKPNLENVLEQLKRVQKLKEQLKHFGWVILLPKIRTTG